MKLKELWNNLRNELIVDAAQCLSSKASEEDKAGKLLAMAMKADKLISDAATEWDSLAELNQKMMKQNEELLRKLEDLQKMQSMHLDVTNGLYGRFDHLDNSILSMNAKSKKND